MSLDAGSVFAVLGAKFNPAGFAAYESRVASAVSKTESAEKRMTTSNQRSSRAMELLGTAARGAAVGGLAGFAAAAVFSVKKAADFEQQLSQLGSVTNATGATMDKFKKQAMDAGAATKYSALDAAKAQTELAKGGLSTAQILGGGLKGALALAAAGNLDLSVAASTTANALNLFGLSGSQAGHVADALATAANKTTADVGDFASALTQGGGAAKAAGLSFDQTVVALEALAQAGVKGSDGGTSLKTAMAQIAKPTTQAGETMKKLGLEFFDAQGKIKPLPAIAKNLQESLGGLTNQQRLAALQTIAGTDGFRTLLALYDQGPEKLRQLATATAQHGSAVKVAASNQDNFAGKLENFKGSVETLGIEIGSKLLPGLTSLAEKGTKALNNIDGAAVGDKIAAGFETAGHVLGDFAHDGAQVARVLIDIGSALHLGDAGNIEAIVAGIAGFKVASFVLPEVVALSGAISGLILNARTAPSLAAFFAEIPVSPITAAALAVAGLTAYLVHSAGAESADEAATRANAAAKRDLKSAVDDLHGSERTAVEAKNAAVSATDRVKAAEERLATLRKDPKASPAERAQAEHDLTQAMTDSSRAHSEYATALHKVNDQENVALTKANDRVRVSKERRDALQKEAEQAGHQSSGMRTGSAAAEHYDDVLKKLAKANREYSAAQREFGQANRVASIATLDQDRIQHGLQAVLPKNAAAYQFLAGVLRAMPKDVKARYLLTGTQSAAQDLADLSADLIKVGKKEVVTKILAKADNATQAVAAFKAVLAGVPARKVASILGKTSGKDTIDALTGAINKVPKSTRPKVSGSATGKGEIDALSGAMRSVPGSFSRTVTLTTIHEERFKKIYEGIYGKPKAAGRGPGGAEAALVGEGRVPREYMVDPATGEVQRVDGPTVMNLSPTAYVVPTDPRYRGRALGFMADIARDMGLPGYAAGRSSFSKKAANKAAAKLPIPERVQVAAVDDTELGREAKEAKGLYTDWQKDLKKARADETRTAKALGRANGKKAQTAARKDHDTAAAKRDHLEHDGIGRKRYIAWQHVANELKALHQENAKLDALQKRQDTDRTKMENASRRGDIEAYNAAKADRAGVLAKLQATYGRALQLAKPGSSIAADLDASLQGAIAEALADPPQFGPDPGETEADRMAQDGFSDAERQQLLDIRAREALAALTQDLGDDKAAALEEEGLLSQVLGETLADPAHRGGSAVIADIAGQLKSNRDNIASMAAGSTVTNSNPDLQAQLDQANARADAERTNSQVLSAAVAAFGGSGDIGTGRPGSAYGAAQVVFNQTNNMLHPSDPSVLKTIGEASVRGFGLQGNAPTPRVSVGI